MQTSLPPTTVPPNNKNEPPKKVEMPNSIIETYIDKEYLESENEVVLSSEFTKKEDPKVSRRNTPRTPRGYDD